MDVRNRPPRLPRKTNLRAVLANPACNVAGTTRLRIDWTILIIPATPAAHCVWPIFDLTEPTSRGRAAE